MGQGIWVCHKLKSMSTKMPFLRFVDVPFKIENQIVESHMKAKSKSDLSCIIVTLYVCQWATYRSRTLIP